MEKGNLPRTIERSLDLFETFVSIVLFTIMFAAIVAQVFSRYVLRQPLTWPYELSIYCYIYIVFLGAGVAARRDSHIVFELFFERFRPRTRLIITIITNLFIVAVLAPVLRAGISYMTFIGDLTSSALRIPVKLLVLAFPVGMGLVVLFLLVRAVAAARELAREPRT